MQETFQLNLAINIKYKNDDYFIFLISDPEKIAILFLPLGLSTPLSTYPPTYNF